MQQEPEPVILSWLRCFKVLYQDEMSNFQLTASYMLSEQEKKKSILSKKKQFTPTDQVPY